MVDYSDAFVERMFPIEVLDLFGIESIRLSNYLVAMTNSQYFIDELESIREEMTHFDQNNGRHNSMYQPINPYIEASYLSRM